jgi:hypothetical protein
MTSTAKQLIARDTHIGRYRGESDRIDQRSIAVVAVHAPVVRARTRADPWAS